VNLLHDAKSGAAATRTSLLGPFYRESAPAHALGAAISRHEAGVPEILLWGQVSDAAGRALPGARIEVWQTSSAGQYDLQEGDGSAMNYRGTLYSDAQGNYHFRTVRPLGYSIPMDGPVGELVRAQAREGCRPAHIHFLISAPGHRELVTALYFRDRYLEGDAVFGASADLVATEAARDPAAPVPGLPSVHFSFSLARQGAAEAGAGRVGADPSKVGSGAR
jgi:catechol 1,2-dioxygenase/hydroxyquinol 1,2-dioxygenase